MIDDLFLFYFFLFCVRNGFLYLYIFLFLLLVPNILPFPSRKVLSIIDNEVEAFIRYLDLSVGRISLLRWVVLCAMYIFVCINLLDVKLDVLKYTRHVYYLLKSKINMPYVTHFVVSLYSN